MNTRESKSDTPRLRILSFGAGAIGTYIGGSLALAGHQVVFLERTAAVTEISQQGMRLDVNGRTQSISNLLITDSYEEAFGYVNGYFDLALFAIKSYDTDTALLELLPVRDRLPPFLCLQNGVENEGLLSQMFGDWRVIPGTVTSAISRIRAGSVTLERLRGVGISTHHPLSKSLVEIFNKAGLNARPYTDPLNMKWSKLLTNLLANATSAILEMPPSQIFKQPLLYDLEIRQLREALTVMKALELKPIDLPSTPVRWLVRVMDRFPPALSRPIIRRAVGSGRGGKMPSFYIDLQSGRGKSEVAYLNGAVVRFGQSLNIPTPVNRILTETLISIASQEQAHSSFAGQSAKLLSLMS